MVTSAARPPTSGYVHGSATDGLVAWLFVAGGMVQMFLAGLSVFDAADAVTHWQDHTDFGRMLGSLAYLFPILALIGRVGMPRIGHALVIAILFVVQIVPRQHRHRLDRRPPPRQRLPPPRFRHRPRRPHAGDGPPTELSSHVDGR